MIKYAEENKIKLIINLSTISIYGRIDKLNLTEKYIPKDQDNLLETPRHLKTPLQTSLLGSSEESGRLSIDLSRVENRFTRRNIAVVDLRGNSKVLVVWQNTSTNAIAM